MEISLPITNRINIQEIEMLKSILGISYNSSTKQLELEGSFSVRKLIAIYFELKNSIWNSSNITQVTNELELSDAKRSRLHYFGNGKAISLDSYLSKMGLLEHDTLIEDPLCFPMSVKSSYEGHITKNPKAYVKHMFENAVSIICLEDWVEKGYVYFIPSLPLIDIDAFWKLGKLNEQIASSTDFENQPGTIKSIKYGLVEGKINLMLEASRLSQNHYTIDHIKSIFPQITTDEAQSRLELFKTQTLFERERSVVQWALDNSQLSIQEKISLLSYFERTRPFNIERYMDVSEIDQGLMAFSGMPLLHATYMSERFNCIPSTDNLGLMYGYEGWCQAVGHDFSSDFERVRTKVELPFSFLDNIPLEFIERAREQGRGHVASIFLDQEWAKIRNTKNLRSYQIAARKFSEKVTSDFRQLSDQHEHIIDELLIDVVKSELIGLGAFAAFNLTTQIPVAIIGSLATMFASVFDTVKTFRRSKNELQIRPISVFLEASKFVNKNP